MKWDRYRYSNCFLILLEVMKVDLLIGGGLLNGQFGRKTGLPIGNLTSQLFANVYMDAFDHFIKEDLRERFYLRYTDDAVILSESREHLVEILPWIEAWLWQHRRLELHPKKLEIRKLSQGIDFLGYVTLPEYRRLRTKTRRRLARRINETNVSSYLGVLEHCSSYNLKGCLLKALYTNVSCRDNLGTLLML